jgi:CubicO group peptidase (beta-lactamase class C family)
VTEVSESQMEHTLCIARDVLEEGRRELVFPAASLWIADGMKHCLDAHVGGADAHSIWDLASLTKPIAVASLAMKLQAKGVLNLDQRPARSLATVRELLGHRSGLPAWWDLSKVLAAQFPGWHVGTSETRLFVRTAIEQETKGGVHAARYSDLGYMLLGWHLEELTGCGLDDLIEGYGVLPRDRSHLMPAGHCVFRGRELCGEVNDLNTYLLGGVAGHAGLFGSAAWVGEWALDLLRAYRGQPSTFSSEVVRSYWSSSHFDDADTWVLGFDTPTPGKSSAGTRIGPHAVGHLGFTGTSVWIDPELGRIVVLLTNRVGAPPEAEQAIKRFRPRLHDAIFDALNGA